MERDRTSTHSVLTEQIERLANATDGPLSTDTHKLYFTSSPMDDHNRFSHKPCLELRVRHTWSSGRSRRECCRSGTMLSDFGRFTAALGRFCLSYVLPSKLTSLSASNHNQTRYNRQRSHCYTCRKSPSTKCSIICQHCLQASVHKLGGLASNRGLSVSDIRPWHGHQLHHQPCYSFFGGPRTTSPASPRCFQVDTGKGGSKGRLSPPQNAFVRLFRRITQCSLDPPRHPAQSRST